MLAIISRFKSSFASLLSEADTVIDVNSQFATIQDAMLCSLLEHLTNEPVLPKVFADITRAYQVQTLWYLRSDLLGSLSQYCGEQVARQKLDVITEMFRSIIPESQMPNRLRMRR